MAVSHPLLQRLCRSLPNQPLKLTGVPPYC
jgi:hypothetical protein